MADDVVVPLQEMVNVDLLKLDDKNPNKMTSAQQAALELNIQRYGFIVPIITNKDFLVADGEHRLLAAKALGMVKVPVVRLDVSDVDRRLLRQVLNKLKGEHDYGMDVEELKFLVDAGVKDELLSLCADGGIDILLDRMNSVELVDEDLVPEVKKTDVKKGDVFLLGCHRVMCGDSTSKEDVEKLMSGDKADLFFTDPPYGVNYGEKNRFLNTFQPAGRCLDDIKNDVLSKDELFSMLTKAFSLANEYGKNDCSYYVTAPQGGELGLMMMMMMNSGLPVRHVLIWNKNRPNFSLGRLDYEYQHEPILFTWKEKHNFYGIGTRTSVWNFDKELKCDLHPTMKPVMLIENALLNSSKEKDVVCDWFGGSGSTLIACEKLNRHCKMMELSPELVEVICQRYEKLFGKKRIKVS